MSTITLPASCDRTAAKALFPEVSEAVGPVPLLIDAGGVEKVGQAMLQLLVSAARSEGGIEIAASSPAFDEALRLSGLQSVILAEGSK